MMKMESRIKYVCGVYVLTGDLNGEQIVKVGKTEAGLDNRVSELNRCCYGGVSRWTVHAWLDSCSERVATAVEGNAHHLLYQHQIIGLPNGHGGEARELFSVSASDAADAVWDARNEINGSIFIRADDKASRSQIVKRKSYSWSWLMVLTALAFCWAMFISGEAVSDVEFQPCKIGICG